jgi:hypothetical protein
MSTALLGPVSVGEAFNVSVDTSGLPPPVGPSDYYCRVEWGLGAGNLYTAPAVYDAGGTLRCGSITLPASTQPGREHSTAQIVTVLYGPSIANLTTVLDGPGDQECIICRVLSFNVHVCIIIR